MGERVRRDRRFGSAFSQPPSDHVMSRVGMEVFLEGHLDLVEHEIRRLLHQVETTGGPGEGPFRWRQPREARTWLRAWTSLNYLVHARAAIMEALEPPVRTFD